MQISTLSWYCFTVKTYLRFFYMKRYRTIQGQNNCQNLPNIIFNLIELMITDCVDPYWAFATQSFDATSRCLCAFSILSLHWTSLPWGANSPPGGGKSALFLPNLLWQGLAKMAMCVTNTVLFFLEFLSYKSIFWHLYPSGFSPLGRPLCSFPICLGRGWTHAQC